MGKEENEIEIESDTLCLFLVRSSRHVSDDVEHGLNRKLDSARWRI